MATREEIAVYATMRATAILEAVGEFRFNSLAVLGFDIANHLANRRPEFVADANTAMIDELADRLIAVLDEAAQGGHEPIRVFAAAVSKRRALCSE